MSAKVVSLICPDGTEAVAEAAYCGVGGETRSGADAEPTASRAGRNLDRGGNASALLAELAVAPACKNLELPATDDCPLEGILGEGLF